MKEEDIGILLLIGALGIGAWYIIKKIITEVQAAPITGTRICPNCEGRGHIYE